MAALRTVRWTMTSASPLHMRRFGSEPQRGEYCIAKGGGSIAMGVVGLEEPFEKLRVRRRVEAMETGYDA